MSRNLLLGIVFTVLLVAVGVLLYLNFVSPPAAAPRRAAGTPSPRAATARATPAPTGTAVAAAAAASATPVAVTSPGPPAKKSLVTLYFEGTEEARLYPEEREAEEAAEPAGRARRVLEELARGPESGLLPTLPEGTTVREVYLDEAGVAYVDFSRQIRDVHIGGSEGEIMTVDSVVNSLAASVPEVKAVQILVDGRPIATLAGHIDLSEPLRPRSDFLATVH